MAINADDVLKEMVSAAAAAFGTGWDAVQKYAPAEFRKMALQIEDIANNVAAYELDSRDGYAPETGRILLQMQRRSCEAVLVATTHLTLLAVQKALDAILDVLKKTFKGVLMSVV